MSVVYILIALLVLLLLITVHEFGHYVTGKLLGFKINEFSIGFGKALYKKTKRNGEVFSVRLVPLGGFCAFEGEDEENPSPKAFNNQKPWKRMIVLAGGVFFNFLFGVLSSVIYLLVSGFAVPEIAFFTPANQNAGFEVGDRIVAVDGVSIEAYRQMSSLTGKYALNEKFSVTVERKVGDEYEIVVIDDVQKYTGPAFYFASKLKIDQKIFKNVGGTATEISLEEFNEYLLSIEPVKNGDKYEDLNLNSETVKFYKSAEMTDENAYSTEELENLCGITFSTGGTSLGFVYRSVSKSYGFFEALFKAWPFSFYLGGTILSALGGIFTGATTLADMGGTFTAIAQMAEVTSWGFNQFLLLLPLLSINLALFNFLPIPALDGARALFVGIEAVRGKPINRKVEGWIHTIGLFVLFALVIFLDGYQLITRLL